MLVGISEALALVMSLFYGPMFSELPTLKESTRCEHSMEALGPSPRLDYRAVCVPEQTSVAGSKRLCVVEPL